LLHLPSFLPSSSFIYLRDNSGKIVRREKGGEEREGGDVDEGVRRKARKAEGRWAGRKVGRWVRRKVRRG
jgi:hypothetical protein